ncbi:hypothetical protein ABN034_26640 [Actinopolymorpha sp. B11F2]|uniref:hypothetical protein n=1 Tax=Actinopolymorpha sp. B11F2 TaxID=3160862 RepID=UPI0032E389E3
MTGIVATKRVAIGLASVAIGLASVAIGLASVATVDITTGNIARSGSCPMARS